MNAIGWGGKTLEQVGSRLPSRLMFFTVDMLFKGIVGLHNIGIKKIYIVMFQVYEDVSQCCQALSQRLGTQPYFFNKQYVSVCYSVCQSI